MKLVINKCYGGYSISPEAALWLFERGFDEPGFKIATTEYWGDPRSATDGLTGHDAQLKKWREYIAQPKSDRRCGLFLTVFSPDEKLVLDTRPENRAAPLLVKCVEELGEAANGACAELKIVEIPDGIDWHIDEYDGVESVHEAHRSW